MSNLPYFERSNLNEQNLKMIEELEQKKREYEAKQKILQEKINEDKKEKNKKKSLVL